MKTIPREVIKKVQEFRQATGLEEIEDLPAGIKKNHQSCIFARAFNFECSVGLGRSLDRTIEVRFKDKERADQLAALFDTEAKTTPSGIAPTWPWHVILRGEFYDVARAFDDDKLPARYYERGQITLGHDT